MLWHLEASTPYIYISRFPRPRSAGGVQDVAISKTVLISNVPGNFTSIEDSTCMHIPGLTHLQICTSARLIKMSKQQWITCQKAEQTKKCYLTVVVFAHEGIWKQLTRYRPPFLIALPPWNQLTSGRGSAKIRHSNRNRLPSSSCLINGFWANVGAIPSICL